MTLEPPDPPVDITKPVRRRFHDLHRLRLAGVEPRWASRPFGSGWRYVCADCARPPGQHYNPGGQRWWDCAEIDAIGADIAHYSQPVWRRWRDRVSAALYCLTHRNT
jgi:hypothetical protein